MARKRQERGHGQHKNGNHGPRAPKVRSHSNGDYTCPPTTPRPIKICSTHIYDNAAKKTLKAILRAQWPVGAFSLYSAPKSFWPTVLSEFRRYYCYPPGVSNAEGDAGVKQHVTRAMTQTLYEDKCRAETDAEKEGTSLLEQCPTYYNIRVWQSFCNHWRKRSFKKKSATNKQNRGKVKVVHTTGAKPFNKFKEDLTQKYNEPPTPVQFWEESHKIKDTGEWASEEARLIGERMRTILASKESTPNDWNSGISVLIEAQGPIKKNRILGLPRVRANTIISHVQQPQGTQRTRSNSSNNETLAELVPRVRVDSVVSGKGQPRGTLKVRSKSNKKTSGNGVRPSRSGPRIPNETLAELVPRGRIDSVVSQGGQPRGTLKLQSKGSKKTSGSRAGPSRSGPKIPNETLAELVPRVGVDSVVSHGEQPRGMIKIQSKSSNNTSDSGAGPSRSGPGIPNELLVELVERTLWALRSDPSFGGSNHPSREQLHLLAQEVIGGSRLSYAPRVYEVMKTEMVHLMVRIFEGAFQDLLPRGAK